MILRTQRQQRLLGFLEMEFSDLITPNDLVTQLLSIAIVTICSISLVRHVIRLYQLPPGPWGLPFVGYVPWIGTNAHETFAQLGKQYGGVYSVNLGSKTMVILNDWPSIKASLVEQPRNFIGRPNDNFIADVLIDRKDIAISDGEAYVTQRKFVVKSLRSIGMGKRSMEGLIMEVIHKTIDTIATFKGKNIEMESLFFKPIIEMNWSLITRHRFEEKELEIFEKDISVVFKIARGTNPLVMFPWLRFLPPNGYGYKDLITSNDRVKAVLKRLIQQHLTDRNDNMDQDFIDLYLHAIKTEEEKSKPAKPPFQIDHLLGSLWDMFNAGVDTTHSTFLWGFLYLALNPEVQRRVQVELDSTVGRQRLPNMDDMSRLPYLEATIMEIHRRACVVPLSLPHRVINTSKIHNYTIPKDTICLQNIYAIHHDPGLWQEPDKFKPERFLDDKNNVTWPQYLMPFSIGPRLCIGKAIAEMELRLFFSCLLHTFNFSLPKDRPKPTLQSDVAFTLKPLPYSLHVSLRDVHQH